MTEDSIAVLQLKYQTYARQKCFIGYSEQAPWAVDLLSACEEVLSHLYNLEIDYARKHFAVDGTLRQKAFELIANARYGIYDLSFWRRDDRSPWQMPRNVMIELGMAIALNRPILLLRHASNRDLALPEGLQGISNQILEFSGTSTLKKVLAQHIPMWINIPPEKAWWNRHCMFGERICTYREAYPSNQQFGKKELRCTISDGKDPCRDDFRSVIEEVVERFSDVNHIYSDSLSINEEDNFLLCSHCKMTRSSSFAIYRITSYTPAEVFIAIGISLVLEVQFKYQIPKILISEDVQDIPSLLSGYEVCAAKNDKERKQHLMKSLPDVLKVIRQTSWKPRPLPFIEVLANQSEEIECQGGGDSVSETSNRTDIENENENVFEFELNDRILVVSGPFKDFEGEITGIDLRRKTVKALLSIFGRNTPVELDFGQIEQSQMLTSSAKGFYRNKVRIYDLSKELNLENKDILTICGQIGVAAKSHSSSIDADDAASIRLAARSYQPSATPTSTPSVPQPPRNTAPLDKPRKQQILQVRRSPDSSSVPPPANSSPPKLEQPSKIQKPQNNSIYVGNLSYAATAEDLKEVFSEYGTVKRVQLPVDRETGRIRGFAFIEMATESEANAAIQDLDRAEWLGREMRVNQAKPRAR
jgi:transcription antitermination factor NusG